MKPTGERVLVIDDDQVALELLTATIQAAGFEVIARRVPPPVQEVKRLGVAAVICDLVMEAQDGDRVLSSFHSEPELRNVPFILISADGHRLDFALEKMPWLHCVRKDGALAAVIGTLHKLIERSRAMETTGQFRFAEPGTGNHRLPEPPSGRHRFGSEPEPPSGKHRFGSEPEPPSSRHRFGAEAEPPSGRHRFGSEPEPPSGRHRFGSEPEPPSGRHRFGVEPGTGNLRALPEPAAGNHRLGEPPAGSHRLGEGAGPRFGGDAHTGSHGRSGQVPARDRLRLRFFEQLRDTTRALRPYLIGGVLGPRAYEEVRKRFAQLRSEAAMSAPGTVMVEALTLCERLTELAQRDLRAMELLGGATAWLATLDANQPFPLTLDGVPALSDAKTLLGVR